MGLLLTRVIKQDTVCQGGVWAFQKEQNQDGKRSGEIGGETLDITGLGHPVLLYYRKKKGDVQ